MKTHTKRLIIISSLIYILLALFLGLAFYNDFCNRWVMYNPKTGEYIKPDFLNYGIPKILEAFWYLGVMFSPLWIIPFFYHKTVIKKNKEIK